MILHHSVLAVLALVALGRPLAARVDAWIDENTSGVPRVYAPGTSITINGSAADGAQLQWFHDQFPLPNATSSRLTLTHMSSSDSGNYRLRAASGGTVEMSDDVTVNVLPLPPSPVDTSFSFHPPEGRSFIPRVVGFMADGRMLITNIITGEVFRLRDDGSIDDGYHYSDPESVSFLASFPDGRLITSTPSSGYRRAANGSRDPLPLPVPFDSTKPLDAAVVQPDGRLIIAQGNLLVRLNADDSADSSFNPDAGIGPDYEIYRLTLDSLGRVYVHANPLFYTYPPNPPSEPVVVRLLPSGARDTYIAVHIADVSISPFVYPLNDGRILVQSFGRVGCFFAMRTAEGISDPAWTETGADNDDLRYVLTFAVDPAGRIFYPGDLSYLKRASLTPTSWVADPTFYAGGRSAHHLDLTPSGQLLVIGSFDQWNGHPTTDIVRLNANASIDPNLLPVVVDVSPQSGDPVMAGSTQTLVAHIQGNGPFSYQWLALDGQALPTETTAPKLVLTEFSSAKAGRYQVRVTTPAGTVLSKVFRQSEPISPLDVQIGTATTRPSLGQTVTLTSTVFGSGPFTYQWVTLEGRVLPGNTVSPDFIIPSFSLADAGRYQLRVNGPGGVAFYSNVIELKAAIPPYLANLSGRAMTGAGENTVIAGLMTKVSGASSVLPALLRGSGPALKPLGVNNGVPNPAIDLFDPKGSILANNDQWSVNPETATAAVAVGAFAFSPGSNDAALLHDFPSGTATLMLKSQSQGDGIGLVEIYRLSSTDREVIEQSLLNLSLRARTGPGEQTTIAGFVIADPEELHRPARVLLRAVGPTLTAQGIEHPLENPVLTVFNAKGGMVAQNDDWAVTKTSGGSEVLAAAAKQVGAFALPADSKDAALLLELPAGAYTMHATGGEGVVLLEIYLMP